MQIFNSLVSGEQARLRHGNVRGGERVERVERVEPRLAESDPGDSSHDPAEGAAGRVREEKLR